MLCCPECFGDQGLRFGIFPSHSTKTGDCPYCQSENVSLLEASALREYFELVISTYKVDPSGKLLVDCFRFDWGLFQHARMDNMRAKDLLAEILDDGDIVRKLYIPSAKEENYQLGDWNALREELRYKNRFFPKIDIRYDRLSSLLWDLTSNPSKVQKIWFRSRIQVGATPYQIEEMGAPPRERATHGRANPAGIPYLYLASNERTAVSETRPHTGETACIAAFKIADEQNVIDLRNPQKMFSPFLQEDPGDIARLRSEVRFLERLGEELTRPVLPHAAAIDYTPSQYLCEFIKSNGYDGVLYRSSVSDGINLALFDPNAASCESVRQYGVKKVSVQIEAVG